MKFLFTLAFVKVAICSALIFIVLDLLWLSLVARKLYFDQLGYLAAIENNKIIFKLPVGLLVQFIISLGLTVFIVMAMKLSPFLLTTVLTGAFAGFVLYCTYDLTNLSFIKNYPYFITIIDIAWGTVQGIFAGFYVYYLSKLFNI